MTLWQSRSVHTPMVHLVAVTLRTEVLTAGGAGLALLLAVFTRWVARCERTRQAGLE